MARLSRVGGSKKTAGEFWCCIGTKTCFADDLFYINETNQFKAFTMKMTEDDDDGVAIGEFRQN